MRTRWIATLTMVFVIALLVPTSAWAVRVTAAGSVVLRGDPPLSGTELVVTVITSTPSLERAIVQQLPTPGFGFTVPFFVNEEKGNPAPGDLGTLLILTNTTNAPLTIIMQFSNLNGSLLFGPTAVVLGTRETRILRVSDILP